MQEFVLFDDGVQNRAILLQRFVYQDVLPLREWGDLDGYLQRGWAQQLYCAILVDYVASCHQADWVNSDSGCLKIIWFAEKVVLDDVPMWLCERAGVVPAGISTPIWSETEAEYTRHIEAIHAAIERGETYQINYTIQLHFTAYGHPIRLYGRLRQRVPYGALVRLPEGGWHLCFSPELFLKINADGEIITEPMKGTAPILGDGLDEQRAHILQHDVKNRAENTMIVDLLRNDLGKLAQIGGVSVPEPFKVRAFGKVWQMTSVVKAQLKRGTSVAALFQAAFPCGSITGAPKRKSMEIIAALESAPRGLYTGSMGFLEPVADSVLGYAGCLNVVIRTITLSPKQVDGCGEYDAVYGVGSGIVMDSRADEEYAECGWKARFLTELRPECDLFETMRVESQHIPLLSQHLMRMAQSARALNIPFVRDEAETVVEQALSELDKASIYRLKLTLSASGSLKTVVASLAPLPANQTVIISKHILPNHHFLRRHKTSYRAEYDCAVEEAAQRGAFDALLFNQRGELLEGGRSSVMILWENQWLTPALDLDILPSIARAEAMRSGSVVEAKISREMVLAAKKIRVGNALHGWFEVSLLPEN